MTVEEHGFGHAGRIIKGPVAARRAQGTGYSMSSIVSKDEIVITQEPRERKGFGCEARRFEEFDPDNPGPGHYGRTGSLDSGYEPSIGKKGFGSMVSKGERFKRRLKYTGPGPADYTASAMRVSADFNRASNTACFQATGGSLRNSSDSLGPGPCGYFEQLTRHGADRLSYDSAPGARSAFLARPHALELQGNVEGPPPNAYELGDLWDRSPYRGANNSTACSFAAPRAGGFNSAPPSSGLLELRSKNADSGPGPGAYDSADYASISTSAAKVAHRGSATFVPLEFVDKMGRSLYAPKYSAVPGPGTYYNDALDGSGAPRPNAMSAPFVSRTAGHADVNNEVQSDAPGPAYYTKSSLPSRKSFHSNVLERFLPRA